MPVRILLLVSSKSYRSPAFLAAAQRLGLEVVQAIDLPPELAAYWHVDLGVPFDRPEEAAAGIVDYARSCPVDAIVPVDDSATVLAALASQALGLPYTSPEAALAARDKHQMRMRFAAAGVPCPHFHLIPLADDPERLAQAGPYPCVLKPLRLSGSRGVIRADNPAQFVAAFGRIKRMLLADGQGEDSVHLLVEGFIPGFEVALEGLLSDGHLLALALFDKPDPLDGPFFEETIYVTPSRLPASIQAEIRACAESAALSLGLREGPVHAELRVNEQGPWMVELAGRSIGGLCSSILEFGSGMTLEEIILRHAAGMTDKIQESPLTATSGDQASGVMMIPIPSAGWFKQVEGIDEATSTPFVEGVTISVKPNQRIVPLPEGSSYLGFIFAKGPTASQVESALREAHSRLRFQIQPEIPVLPSRR